MVETVTSERERPAAEGEGTMLDYTLCVLCSEGNRPTQPRATDTDRQRLLDRLGVVHGVDQAVEAPLEIGALLGEQEAQDRDALFESLKPIPHRPQLDPVGGAFFIVPAGADAELEAAARRDVERAGHVGQDGRMAVQHSRHQDTPSDP